MRTLFAGLVLALLLPFASAAAPLAASGALKRAETLVEDLKFAEAGPELDAVLAAQGNSRETLIRAFWLKGMVAATVNKPEVAREAMRALVAIAPDFKPDANQPKRVMTPWFEARGWAEANGALTFVRVPADPEQPHVARLRARVQLDPLKMARAVRFHLREDAAAWRTAQATLVSGEASVPTSGQRVEWWAELLGERAGVLIAVGSELGPLVEVAAPAKVAAKVEPVAKADDKPVALPPSAVLVPAPTPLEAAPNVVAQGTDSGRPFRVASYVVFGSALAVAATGIYFGVTSNSEAARISGGTRAPDGAITSLTQREADRLNGDSRSHATVANALFIGAGALAVAGGALWWSGHRLSVTPTPAGVSVGGELP